MNPPSKQACWQGQIPQDMPALVHAACVHDMQADLPRLPFILSSVQQNFRLASTVKYSLIQLEVGPGASSYAVPRGPDDRSFRS